MYSNYNIRSFNDHFRILNSKVIFRLSSLSWEWSFIIQLNKYFCLLSTISRHIVMNTKSVFVTKLITSFLCLYKSLNHAEWHFKLKICSKIVSQKKQSRSSCQLSNPMKWNVHNSLWSFFLRYWPVFFFNVNYFKLIWPELSCTWLLF